MLKWQWVSARCRPMRPIFPVESQLMVVSVGVRHRANIKVVTSPECWSRQRLSRGSTPFPTTHPPTHPLSPYLNQRRADGSGLSVLFVFICISTIYPDRKVGIAIQRWHVEGFHVEGFHVSGRSGCQPKSLCGMRLNVCCWLVRGARNYSNRASMIHEVCLLWLDLSKMVLQFRAGWPFGSSRSRFGQFCFHCNCPNCRKIMKTIVYTYNFSRARK